MVESNSGNYEDAEDIFQEGLIFVHSKLIANALVLNCSFGTYLYAVCRNMWWRKLKKQQRTTFTDNILKFDYVLSDDILSQIEVNEKYRLVRKHFFRLNEPCQDIIRMFLDKMSMREIANKLGLSEGYARKKKFKCKQALTASLEKDQAFHELLNKKDESYGE